MNDVDESGITYIALRRGVFSKALSGIFLILFPKRNLKKNTIELTLFYLLNLHRVQRRCVCR